MSRFPLSSALFTTLLAIGFASTTAAAQECVNDLDLGTSTGDSVATGNNSTLLNNYDSNTVNGDGTDQGFTWSPPSTGAYTVSTLGSTYDTTLYIRTDCANIDSEVASNDDIGGGPLQSQVTEVFDSATTYTIVVDAFNDASGDFVLNISDRLVCSEADLGSAVGDNVASGTTAGATNDYSASCGSGANSPDQAFTWTAPSTGDFIIDTSDSGYDTVLHIQASCFDTTELECNDDAGSAQSQVTLSAVAGTEYLLIVDGFGGGNSGAFQLDINAVAAPTPEICDDDDEDNDNDTFTDCEDSDCDDDPVCAPVCPVGTDIGSAVGAGAASGTTDGATPDEFDTSCQPNNGGDVTFDWTAPSTGDFVIDTQGSAYDTVLSVLDCAADPFAELECNDDDGEGFRSQLVLSAVEGLTYSLIIDAFGSDTGDFLLNIGDFGDESCTDGVDNDLDDDIDCADSDCDADAACAPEPEICDDGTDNDNDTFTDCEDSDCDADPACATICPDNDLGMAVGDNVASGTTAGATNDYSATCGSGANSPDQAFTWTAPSTGDFIIDTSESGYDTVLHIQASCLDATELECNDDAGTAQSEITLTATEGTEYLLIVDGFGGSNSGAFQLDINAVPAPTPEICDDGTDNDNDTFTDCEDSDCDADPACARVCPDNDLGMAVGDNVASGTTAGATNDYSATCGNGANSPDQAFTWTAPSTGDFIIDTSESGYDTVLHIQASCLDATELECNDDAGTAQSEITLTATEGTEYLLIVDGFGGSNSGAFQLDINAVPAPTPEICDDGTDNDNDTFTDCEDSDCDADPACDTGFDCSNEDPDACNAATSLIDQVNNLTGGVINEDGPARLSPDNIFAIVEEVTAVANANGCNVDTPTIVGVQGGTYNASTRTWDAEFDIFGSMVGTSAGSIDTSARTFNGTYTEMGPAGATGLIGDIVNQYNPQGQLVGNRDSLFMSGRWIRVAGLNGVHVSLMGTCSAPIAPSFDGWFDGNLGN